MSNSIISKSDFLRFSQCPKFAWLFLNRKDLIPKPSENDLISIKEGYDVENLAYKLFKGGINVFQKDINVFTQERNLDNNIKTKILIENNEKTLFQASFLKDDLFCRSDILNFNLETNKWDIYEIKATANIRKESGKLEEKYLIDVAFQKYLIEKSGYKVGDTYVVYINNEYIKNGDINVFSFFKKENIINEVDEYIKELPSKIEILREIFKMKNELKIEIISQCKKPQECSFMKYCRRNIPIDSIYNFQFREKKLFALLDEGIIEAKNIPEEFLTNDLKRNYVKSLNTEKPYIKEELVKEELSKLKYPLYFLDYETLNPAIPIFDKYKPYQRIPFQYSLHIQETPNSELKHFEFLGKDKKDPAPELLETMTKQIKEDGGSVIVWNKSFEIGVNREAMDRYPEYFNFLKNVNERVFDLMDIFKKGYYTDGKFHGSWSIKKVLPILASELSYKELNIQEGQTASNKWRSMISDEKLSDKDRENIYNNLLKYCKLDTFAMVRILEEINNKIKCLKIF